MKRSPYRSAAPVQSGPAVRGLTALVLLVLGATVAHGAPLHYVMTPFAESAPTIQLAYDVLHKPGASDQERRAALESLAKELEGKDQAAGDDPHRQAVARWLQVALKAQSSDGAALGAGSDGDEQQAPPISNDSLEGASAIYQSHLAKAGGQARRASALLLSVPSSVSGHEDAWSKGIDQLVAQGEVALAIELMESQLMTSLPIRVERRLEMRLVDLLERSGAKPRAVEVLNARWWHTKHKKTREAVAGRLKALGSPIASSWSFVRPLLDVRSGRAPAELKILNKLRKRKGADRALVDWARSILGRLDSKSRDDAVAAMERLKGKMKGDVRRPLWHLGSALVLRKVNRDLEAAMHYAALVSGWPAHPYANRARAEAAWLLSLRGLPGEASALWADAADSTGRSEAQRDGLWWGGFAAVLRGDNERALRDLTRLRDRYGDERDGVAITWDERASYWLGRVYEATARVPEASREYASVAARYPMSWYGLLAEGRVRELAPVFPRLYSDLRLSAEAPLRRALEPVEALPAVEALRLAREPALSLAVAYLRLGRAAEAISALETLLGAGRLTGGGRALLATLYGHGGQEQARQRVLRYGIFMAPDLTPDLREMYQHRYLLTHEEILVTECLSRGVSPSLFAGLVHVESRFKPKARSGVGAVGLAQIMPSTARLTSKALLGKKVTRRQLRKPSVNLALGAALIGALLDHFRGHAPVALASYNAGRGAVRGWLRDRGHLPTDAFVESIPYSQTRRYAMRVMSMAHVYDRLYGFEGQIPPIPVRLPLALKAFDADNPQRP